jgi:RNA polymerase sigma factor (sigma-70 family)
MFWNLSDLEASIEAGVCDNLAKDILFVARKAVGLHRGDVDDIAQEASIRVFVSLRNGKFFPETVGGFFAFVRTVARRTAFDFGRKRKLPVVSDVRSESASEPNDLFELRDLINLPKFEMLRSIYEGHTYGEIAKMKKIPEGTVKSRISNLRKELAKWDCR